MYNFQNIPEELKRLNQWVVWKYEQTDDGKQTKILYNPAGGWRASTADARTWDTFKNASMVFEQSSGGYSGVGFVFTNFDEYCGIDLDATEDPDAYARQVKVYGALNSYSELSPSGKGLHIIVKASIPHGRKRSFIEVYSWGRFFTFTGNVFGDHRPIEDRQELVTRLWEELGNGANPEAINGEAARPDFNDNLINRAASASNGELFKSLYMGNWQGNYPSQSEADQALMNIIVFYTKNKEQAYEIFRSSALGQRDKAQRDKYLEYTFERAYDMTLPPIDMTSLLTNINMTIEANKKFKQTTAKAVTDDLWRNVDPPGLMGDVMKYVYEQSPRPLRDVSLIAALGLFAGICGRCYNVSNTGLNLYLMLLAPTGSGKEAMRTGINSLMHATAYQVMPAALDFLGPSDMASGAGLLKHLAERPMPSFLSLTGEVGLRMQQLSASTANQADITLRKVLLDLYPASKKGGMIRPTVYSDKKNNIEMIYSPNFSWLGESTGSEFYKALNEQHVASGLLPRFTIVEYTGARAIDNENHAFAQPSPQLIENMRQLCELAIRLNQQGAVTDVAFTDEAKTIRREYNKFCDNQMDATKSEPLKQLWNRADLKAMKVAALLAISVNMLEPLIDAHMMRWAISFIHCDVQNLVARFERGAIGVSPFMEGFNRLAVQMVSHIEGHRKASNYTEQNFARQGCVSRSLMTQMTQNVKVFKDNHRLLSDILIDLEKQGVLVKLGKQDVMSKFGDRARAEIYQVNDVQWFYDNSNVNE